MKGLFGLLIVFGSVGGGYVLSHGQLGALWQPFELIIIGGAAGGAFVLPTPPRAQSRYERDPWLLQGLALR